jgi:tRNA-modifying protein YgfZ
MFVSGFSTGFVRLKFYGKDRARFLHNFCTNNVKALSPGSACEAFFADVKAKTLAHGYVLAFEDSHEIWMLPGDPDALEKHLNRYLITEDVKIERVSGVTCVFRNTPELQAAFQTKIVAAETGSFQCFTATSSDPAFAELSDGLSGLVFSWAGCSLVAIGGSQSDSTTLIHILADRQLQPLSSDALERLRIDERFPVTGRDMTGDNLAPEAERNAVAISYSKWGM